MNGNPTIQCQANGGWTILPSCDVPAIIQRANGSCPSPINPERAIIVQQSSQQSGDRYAAGDIIQYGCETGYVLQGFATVRCLSNGTWDRALPSCRIGAVNPGKKTHFFETTLIQKM